MRFAIEEDVGERQRVHGAVLMARLVDRHGRCISPAHIQSIDYSLFQIDARRECRVRVRGHQARLLDVDEVLWPGLVNDEQWKVDRSGYNFRHEVNVADEILRSGGDEVRCEFVYRIFDTVGERTTIIFKVRMVSYDRY